MKVTVQERKHIGQMCDMEDGDLAVIEGEGPYEGYVVQCYKPYDSHEVHYIAIGKVAGRGWGAGCTLPVRRLVAGDVLELSE